MPWQQYVADVGMEILENGLPAYREIAVTIHRQAGKTTECLSWEVDRALFWGRTQHIGYSAQTGLDARSKMVKDQWPLVQGSPLRAGVSAMLKGAAYTAMEFKNGSRIEALASSEESGHGKTLGLGVIDEAFADEDDRREQALGPAMITMADAQKLIFSTAGTERSVFLKRKVDNGRDAVERGSTSGMAYFEWSAPDGADIENPQTWRDCMPALGYTIEEDSVRAELLSMTENEFRRAYLNQWTASDDRVIPAAVWEKVVSAHVIPKGSMVLGADANPERSAASIAVCDSEGRAELVDYRPGVNWLTSRLVELAKKLGAPVVVDSTGPAAPVIPSLQAQEVEVISYGGRELANASAMFFDRVADEKIKVRYHNVLDQAVAGATRRSVGDAWAWGRRQSGVDISPLVAVTLASHVAMKPSDPEPGPFVYEFD
jgi:hypothetical protein